MRRLDEGAARHTRAWSKFGRERTFQLEVGCIEAIDGVLEKARRLEAKACIVLGLYGMLRVVLIPL